VGKRLSQLRQPPAKRILENQKGRVPHQPLRQFHSQLCLRDGSSFSILTLNGIIMLILMAKLIGINLSCLQLKRVTGVQARRSLAIPHQFRQVQLQRRSSFPCLPTGRSTRMRQAAGRFTSAHRVSLNGSDRRLPTRLAVAFNQKRQMNVAASVFVLG
jgi:hypothetical protein